MTEPVRALPKSQAAAVDGNSHTHELLTVDVWDTLLRRRCHPDSVKLHVARYLSLHCAAFLAQDKRDPWTLLALRRQAEKDLGDQSKARGLDDEYRHLDVYRRWLVLAGLDPFPAGDEAREQFLLRLEQIELAQEKYVSYPDPSIVDTLARHAARRVLFLSDFYMPAAALRALISHHGIGHVVADGVVSCEIGLNKRSGRLYKFLHERFGVHPTRHLHVGDSPVADVEAAREAGVTPVHYLPEGEHQRRQQREAMFHARADVLRKSIKEQASIREAEGHEHREAYGYGRQCALLLIGFVLYAVERAVSDQAAKLYYFTREGELFLEIHRRLIDLDAFGFPVPPAQLLHVSRLATFAGSLREFSTAELMRLWNQYSVQSLHALFTSMGMTPALFADRAAKHGLDIHDPIQYPWQDDRAVAFLNDAAVRADVERELADKRAAFLAYLASAGLNGEPTKVGIVDIGWRGTIQDNLAHALPEVDWHGYYLGLNRYLNPQPERVRKSAFGPNLNEAAANADLLDFVAPIEMLCNSPNGSVSGYVVSGESVDVLRHFDPDETRVHDAHIRHFQAGVLDSIPFWASFLRTHAYSSDEIRPVALETWSEIVRHPPPFLARAYFQLNHNETFGMGRFSDKRRLMTTTDVLRALYSRRHRVALRNFLAETGWVPGLLACPDLDPIFRRTLGGLLRVVEIRDRLLRSGRR